MENNIIKKYCLSNIIDLLVPVIPVTYSYYYEKLMIFDYLSFFELLGIIYLAFNIVAYVGTKANTVDGNLSKLFLVDVKTNNRNHLKNISRILIISGFVFSLGSIEDFDFSVFIPLLLFMIPIKFKVEDSNCYSILNRVLMLKYTIN